MKRARSVIAKQMILTRKGGFMHDRRAGRGGSKNEARELIENVEQEKFEQAENKEQESTHE